MKKLKSTIDEFGSEPLLRKAFIEKLLSAVARNCIVLNPLDGLDFAMRASRGYRALVIASKNSLTEILH